MEAKALGVSPKNIGSTEREAASPRRFRRVLQYLGKETARWRGQEAFLLQTLEQPVL